jgi:iron(III) transport system ATP-binding protein
MDCSAAGWTGWLGYAARLSAQRFWAVNVTSIWQSPIIRISGASLGRGAGAALGMVGLSHLADRMPNQLSGGQQQRIALARTVVIEPRVLLDEPLSNLDAGLRVRMRHELLALRRKPGLATIFVTHDQEEVHTTSDRMAVRDGGVIPQVGAPRDLYHQPVNLFAARFLGATNILQGRTEGTGGER